MSDAELAWRARRAVGLSQRAFARLVGVHPGTVAEWESGRGRASRRTRALLRLVEAGPCLARAVLGVDAGDASRPLGACSCGPVARVGRAFCSPHPSAGERASAAESAVSDPPRASSARRLEERLAGGLRAVGGEA